jgi:hypothetical protein
LPTAGILGWIVPGLGQAYAGRGVKALLFFVGIVPAYALGLWLTGFTAVDPKKYGLEFAAHVFAGGPTLLAVQNLDAWTLDAMPRWFDVGRLYVAVAALLNVVAMSDALGEVLVRNQRIDRLRRRMAPAPSVDAPDLLLPEVAPGGPPAPVHVSNGSVEAPPAFPPHSPPLSAPAPLPLPGPTDPREAP